MQEPSPVPAPSAQLVGNTFVEQYYRVLYSSTEAVHQFYQEFSLLSRPESDGTMMTVTTMEAINDMILSLNHEEYKAAIDTADSQDLHEKVVIVLVTGSLTGEDKVPKKFVQSFFLAPEDKGYYLKAMRSSTISNPVRVSTSNVRSVPANIDRPSFSSAKPAPRTDASAPITESTPEK